MSFEEEIRSEICMFGRRMYDRGYVAANDGNISARISENEILITPSGVSKGFMEPDMILKIDIEGNLLEGKLKPSSETKMHLKVYRDRKDIYAVVHAHPPAATAYAVSGVQIKTEILPEAVVNLGNVIIAPYATPSTDEVPNSINNFTEANNAVLLANHGALTWGRNLTQAYFRMESLEHCAKINMLSDIIGGARKLPDEKLKELFLLSGY